VVLSQKSESEIMTTIALRNQKYLRPTMPSPLVPRTTKTTVSGGFGYYPFGMMQEGRKFVGGLGYRWGFNGAEIDSEGSGGGGSTYDYGFRIFNPMLGRFLSVDPLLHEYPWYTTYQFAGNLPIAAIDLDGLEEFIFHNKTFVNSSGKTILYLVTFRYISPNERGNKEQGTFVSTSESEYNQINRLPQLPKYYLKKNTRVYKSSDEINQQAYNEAKKRFEARGGIMGLNYSVKREDVVIRNISANIKFDNDQGLKREEINRAFEALSPEMKENIDNLVGALIFDRNATASVEGLASPLATNLQGSANETSKEKNLLLAQARAENTKLFLISYAKEKYNRDIDETRIITSSRISDSNPEAGNNSNEAKDRAVNIILQNR
jgi:RHS repeat-associated protein